TGVTRVPSRIRRVAVATAARSVHGSLTGIGASWLTTMWSQSKKPSHPLASAVVASSRSWWGSARLGIESPWRIVRPFPRMAGTRSDRAVSCSVEGGERPLGEEPGEVHGVADHGPGRLRRLLRRLVQVPVVGALHRLADPVRHAVGRDGEAGVAQALEQLGAHVVGAILVADHRDH